MNAVGSHPIELVVIDPSGTVMLDDEAVGVALAEAVGAVDPAVDVFQLDDCVSYVAHTRGISILTVDQVACFGDDERARFALPRIRAGVSGSARARWCGRGSRC